MFPPIEDPITIRRAVGGDSGHCSALAQAAYEMYLPRFSGQTRPAPMDADYEAAIARDEVWVAESGHAIVGLLVLVYEPDHVLLENVAVHPGWRGRGVGRRLLELAEERAVAARVPAIRLYTSIVMTENQRLYERIGYVETSRGDDGGFVRVHYEKRLGP